MTIVVLGIMGRSPFAGVAWQALHYLEGCRRLGHDVWYVEDTGDWPFDAEANAVTDAPAYTLAYLARVLGRHGFGERWAYRSAAEGGRLHGLSERALGEVLARADALVNVTGATLLGDAYPRVPVRIYLETDPVQNQVEVAQGREATIKALEAHTHHATFGENLGTPACPIPVERFAWRPTRQPVVLDWWDAGPPPGSGRRLRLTTVTSWEQTGKDVEWRGRVYTWSKHAQFLRFIDLPRRVAADLELALASSDPAVIAGLRARGWIVTDAVALSRDTEPYRAYVRASDGEFTVAKDQYVLPASGWFSDRSACYLAAGRPVITQDTGFGRVLPTGRGLFAFRTAEDVAAAVEAIAGDPAGHARAARDLAHAHFAAEAVLGRLLAEAGL